MKTKALIAVRLGSSRLPAKALMPIMGRPMLGRMLDRVRRSKHLSGVTIATTVLPEDDALIEFAAAEGVEAFRGSADDVLGRLNGAADAAGADVIVEMLGDNPFVHADLIDDVIQFFLNGDYDYASSVTNEHKKAPESLKRFPIGVRVEVFSRNALARCAELAKAPENREHSTSFIHSNPDLFKLGYFEANGRWASSNRPELTFAVNYPENLELIRGIFERCHPRDENFSIADAIRMYDETPALQPLMGNRA